jgi:hypothetical protein
MKNQQPLSTQGSTNEQEGQLGGTANLSLDQLKEEGGIANSVGENPDGFTDQDDFNEIRVPDDLDEPHIEKYQPGDESADDREIGNEHISANDADGNGGNSDRANNATAPNSQLY